MHSKTASIKLCLSVRVLIILCCFLYPVFCDAQKITARIIDLPGSFNRDLLQMSRDDEGFIWFGTNEGVWRFDGSDVKLLDYRNLKLQQNTAPFILYCYKEYLLFGSFNGDLRFYNKKTKECLAYHLPGWITSTSKTQDGELLFFTNDGQAWKFNSEKLLYKSFNLQSLHGWDKNPDVHKISTDQRGKLYVFLRDRIGIVSNDSIRWGPSVQEKDSTIKNGFIMVSSVAISSRYIGVSYRDGELIIYDRKNLLPVFVSQYYQASYCFVVNDGIHVITKGGIKKTSATSPYFTIQDGLLQQDFDTFTMIPSEDGENFLLGTSIGLVDLTLHNNSGNKYNYQQKLVAFFYNKSIRSIYSRNNKFYIGSYTGFYECSADSIREINPRVVYAIRPIDDQRLLLAVEGGSGYAILNTRTGLHTDFLKKPGSPNRYTTALLRDGDSWISGDYFALHRLTEKKGIWQIDSFPGGVIQGPVRQISRIGGDIFIAAQAGVFRLSGDSGLQQIYPAQEALRVYCMLETNDGIWLGTHGNGLVKINQSGKVIQQIGFNEGLASNFVYSIALMDDLLIAGTGRGVSIFDLSAGVLPLPAKKDDNLYGYSSQETNHSAVFYDSALNQVILGGVNGLIFIDRSDYSNARVRKNDRMLLSYIRTGGYEINSSQADLFAYAASEIVLKSKDANIVLKFAVPGDPDQQDGYFRIVGLDDKWQRIKMNQEVNLYALPPGDYTLEARLPSAVDAKDWFVQSFIVEPAFYQTIFFKALLVCVFLAIIYFFWRSKAKKTEREHRLRSAIASDLHDDIGSTLNSISVYTEIATQQLHNGEEKTKALLQKMGIASRNMIDTMSDIVWAIHPKNDHFENVLQRMQFFAGELLSGKNILLKFEADEKTRKLKFSMQERKNIYLIYKEAINNAYKYSGASAVTVTLHKTEGWVLMDIVDDGMGFNLEEKRNSGNGLTNMINRAGEIGGKLRIENISSGGTRVSLQLRRF